MLRLLAVLRQESHLRRFHLRRFHPLLGGEAVSG